MIRVRIRDSLAGRLLTARYGAGVALGALAAGVLPSAGGVVAPAVLHVCHQGCDYAQVQPAIDAAAAGDTILVGPGSYAGGITIGKPLTITGRGPGSTVIAGGGPVITVTAGPVLIQEMTITGGHAPADGGGILNTATLTVINVAVSHNAAAGNGGGIANDGTAPPDGAEVRLVLRGGTITGNTASADGGGLANLGMVFSSATTAMADVSGTSIQGNTAAGFGFGGGVANEEAATMSLRQGSISRNSADEGGGFGTGFGASATIRDATIRQNTAAENGGGMSAIRGSATIQRTGIRQNTAADGGGVEAVGGSLRMTASVVSGNHAAQAGSGGGIQIEGLRHGLVTAAITGTMIDGNSAGAGGGVAVASSAVVTMGDDVISRNTASTEGGGVDGEGLGSTLALDDTSVTANISGGDGGGISNYIAATLTNARVNANSAAGRGGGIFNGSEQITRREILEGAITLDANTSVSRNQAADGGGIYVAGGTATVDGATVHGNAPDDCAPAAC